MNNVQKISAIAVMVDGQQVAGSALATLSNHHLYIVKTVINDALGHEKTCCHKRAILYDIIETINTILSRRATVALCRN